MKRYVLSALAVVFVVAPWQVSTRAAAPVYTVQNLGTFHGEVPTIVGINAHGQVVGNVAGTTGSQAVRYSNGAWEALPGLDQDLSVATGINADGAVVGYRFGASGYRAFRYRDGLPIDFIDPFSNGNVTIAFAINDAGDIVGYGDAGGDLQPFVAKAGSTTPVALPTLGPGTYACGINASSQVAGGWTSSATHGIRIEPVGAPADIQSLDGPDGPVFVCPIDADGRVGGQASHDGVMHAFLWNGSGVDVDPVNSPNSNIEAIAGGLAAGWYTDAAGELRAFAHRDEDGSFDLTSRIDASGWVLNRAKAVNVNGLIAGDGTLDGVPAAFLLTPPAAAADTAAPVISSLSATPSLIDLPSGQMVPVALTVSASDDSAQAPVCGIESVDGGTAADYVVTGKLSASVKAVGGRTYSFTVACADGANNVTRALTRVTVALDTTAPTVDSVSATPSLISNPNGALVPVAIAVTAHDDVDASVACSVSGVVGGAAGDTAVTGALSVQVKANPGAAYSVQVRCADAAGNASTGSVAVTVAAATHDTKPPVIRYIYANRTETRISGVRWELVRLFVFATDNVNHSPFCSITSVTGGAAGSSVILGRLNARVRELRSDLDRTYQLNVKCVDDDGNASVATVSIDPDGRTTYSGDRRRWRW